MKLIDHCPNCFSSTSSDEGNSDGRKGKRKRKRFFHPFGRYAMLIFSADSQLADRDFYSKFYTSSSAQPKYFAAGKKYEIERKHKVKKRELLNDGRSCTTSRDNNIKGESHFTETGATDEIFMPSLVEFLPAD